MKDRSVVNQLPQKDNWETPNSLFDKLKKEFNLNWDLACSTDNIKCERGCLFNRGNNGLNFDSMGYTPLSIWCNPPYSRTLKELFIRKCYELSKKPNVNVVVMLLPVSTSTKIFHEVIYPNAEIRFLKGRVKFKGLNTKGELVENKCGMHDSMLVVFK